jgi:phosphatidylglycerol:prolipoprotein diacylglycerol transferase
LAGGIVGARLLHVILEWDYYSRYPFRSLAIWEGGVSTFGGLLGALLATTAATRWSGLSLGQYVDTVTPGVPLGHAISRLGEFFNEEAFGRPTALPWGLYISPDRRPPGFAASEYFHPAFLYEAVWNAGVFGVTFFLLRKRLERMPGALFLAYLGLYALGRIPIEALRLDSVMVGPYRLGQVLAGGCLLAAGTGIPWVWWRRRASLRAASAGGGGGCHGP